MMLLRGQADARQRWMSGEVENPPQAPGLVRLEEGHELLRIRRDHDRVAVEYEILFLEPGVRFSPGTSAIEIDIPRTSFSRSFCDEAFANLMNARYVPGVANNPTRSAAGKPVVTMNSASTQPAARP